MSTTKRQKRPIKTQASLVRLIEYILNPEKTEDEKCVYHNSINCSVIGTAEQFRLIRRQWDKDSGNLAYHFHQSFAPGETTPQEAHQCGMELAMALFGKEGYQVIFATHLDKAHLHNHFVVNSVNTLTGHKLQTDHAFIRRMRAENDRICRLHNLSVINFQKGTGKSYAEWKIDKNGGFSWRGSIRQDIDAILPEVHSFQELINQLQECGYTVSKRGQYLRLSPPGTNTFFRFAKLGVGYSEEELVDRILFRNHTIPPKIYSASRPTRFKSSYKLNGSFHSIGKRNRLRSLYYVYLYRLRALTDCSAIYRRKLPPTTKQDMLRLRQLSADMCLLSDNHINNNLELSEFYYSIDKASKDLCVARNELRSKLSAAKNTQEEILIRNEIDEINNQLSLLRKKMQSCERIYSRSEEMQNANKQLAKISGGVSKDILNQAQEKNIEMKGNDNNVSRS